MTKTGRRYSEDMINVTANAACAIAYRNALLKVIPKTLTAAVYTAAKKAALGDQKTLETRRVQAFKHFEGLGLTRDRILTRLGKAGIEDVDLSDLELLTGLKTAIKDSEVSLAEAFPVEEPEAKDDGKDRSSQLAAGLRQRRDKSPEESDG